MPKRRYCQAPVPQYHRTRQQPSCPLRCIYKPHPDFFQFPCTVRLLPVCMPGSNLLCPLPGLCLSLPVCPCFPNVVSMHLLLMTCLFLLLDLFIPFITCHMHLLWVILI